MFRLDGKAAIVTGASGELGRAMANGLKDFGARVAVIGRSESLLRLADDGFIPIRGDLTDEDSDAVDQAIEQLGGLDILVTAHGMVVRSPAESFPREEWTQTLEVNLTSVMRTIQAAVPVFLKQGHGKIINVASMLSFC